MSKIFQEGVFKDYVLLFLIAIFMCLVAPWVVFLIIKSGKIAHKMLGI